MIAQGSLTNAFLARLKPDAVVDLARIDPLLQETLRSAREAWPSIDLTGQEFVQYLADRLPVGDDPLTALERMHHGDLYLACACSGGHEHALKVFTEHFSGVITRAAQRVEAQGVAADEARQELMTHLLVARGDRAPAIALYSGQGPLRAYLRVAALHKALHMLKKLKKEPTGKGLDEMLMIADSADDPELAVLKQTYRKDFKIAFQAALADLKSEERNLLRYHFLSDLNTRQIGQLCGIDQSTVVRHLARVRGSLLAATRQRLMANLGLGDSKFQSILRLVQSRLDVSIERMLSDRDD